MLQILLQNATAILLQSATEVYYKMHQVFLLQNATVLLKNTTVITKCDDFITKWDSYHKIRLLLQIATIQVANSYEWQITMFISIVYNEHNKNKFSLLTKCAYMTLN